MKFLLYEYLEGIHKNKEFLHQINKNNNEGFIAFLADFFSFRAEQNISFAQFNNKINKFLENFNEVNAAKSYFKFKLNYSSTFTEKELFDTLWIESKSSIIDIYMTTLKVSQLLSIGDFSDDLKYIVMRNSQELEGLIKDYKISNLIRYYKPELPIAFEEFSKEMVEIGSNYTMGEYKHVFEACKTLIKRRPDCFEIYEYYIKSAMYLNKINLIKNKEASSLSEEIIDIMCSLYNKNTYTEEAASKLLKIIILLSSLDINSHLVHFLSNRVLKDIDKHMLILAELNSTHTNPRFCRVFENNSTSLKFIKNLKNVYQGHNLIETYEAFYKQELEDYVHTQETPIPKLRYDRYIAILLNKIGQSDQAIKKLTNLLESDLVSCPTDVHGYLYEKIIIDLYNINLKQESYKECLKIYVDNYLINSHLTMRLSSSELINFLDYEDEEEIKKDISVPIFYYTFYKNKYEDVYPSYANFMDYSGYERPTQIPVPKDNEQKRKLVFFLKHVCSVEVMVTSIYFDDEQDVRRERINICKILHDIDAENKEEYVKEMSEITQKLRINQRVKQVDESRISIDVKGIRNDDSILYKEGFNRYKKMKGLPETYTVVDINNIDQISKLNETSTVNIIIPGKNQQFVLLKETLIELRDNFIFNEKYGLEPSLSSRIRHGALMNEMRSPFELNNLILSKNTQDSGRYNISSHWKSKLQEYGIDEVLEERLRNILGEFSKKIDEKINEINHEWLRIRTEKRNSNGLFDYTINDFTVLDLFYFFENKDLEKAEEFLI
ncbi:hypothetical protein GYH73_001500 [Bacillus megaterium]|nr:hypothetical protein [Priestia megaterium]